jgi:hypothetical protein
MLSTNDLAIGYIWNSWSEANILAMNTQHSTLNTHQVHSRLSTSNSKANKQFPV